MTTPTQQRSEPTQFVVVVSINATTKDRSILSTLASNGMPYPSQDTHHGTPPHTMSDQVVHAIQDAQWNTLHASRPKYNTGEGGSCIPSSSSRGVCSNNHCLAIVESMLPPPTIVPLATVSHGQAQDAWWFRQLEEFTKAPGIVLCVEGEELVCFATCDGKTSGLLVKHK